MALSFCHVDAFTDKPFSGNQAAVFVLPRRMPERWMQAVAAEMNLSETAFLLKRQGGYSLRWFTPATEVALCGHATLASAHVLLRPGQETRFFTKSGVLAARKRGSSIELDFPSIPQGKAKPPGGLGFRPVYVGRTRADYLVEVGSERVLRRLKPPGFNCIATCRSETRGFDFISRYFAPREGIPEDPVTGSAHCCLGPYWAAKLGKTDLVGYQASARGGVVRVRCMGERVLLQGQAVTVFQGILGTIAAACPS